MRPEGSSSSRSLLVIAIVVIVVVIFVDRTQEMEEDPTGPRGGPAFVLAGPQSGTGYQRRCGRRPRLHPRSGYTCV
jgi:hypothetical protein